MIRATAHYHGQEYVLFPVKKACMDIWVSRWGRTYGIPAYIDETGRVWPLPAEGVTVIHTIHFEGDLYERRQAVIDELKQKLGVT